MDDIDAATAKLRQASPEALLTVAFSLTHRMAYAEREARAAKSCGALDLHRQAKADGAELREQRNRVEEELLRRLSASQPSG